MSPLPHPGSVVDPADFIGREPQVTSLTQLLVARKAPANVAIFGQPRAGKTSLIRYVLRHGPVPLPGGRTLVPVFTNLGHCGTPGDLLGAIAEQLQVTMDDAQLQHGASRMWLEQLEAEQRWRQQQRLLMRALAALRDEAIVPLAVVDEFDAARTVFRGSQHQLMGLRTAVSEPPRMPMVTVSRRNLRDIELETEPGSGFANVFEDLPLPLFSDDDIDEMVEVGAGALRDRIDLSTMGRVCGNHPLLLNRYLLTDLEAGSPAEVNAEAARCTREAFRRIYSDLQERFGEDGLLNSLLEVLFGDPRQVDIGHRQRIVAYDLARFDDGSWQPFSGDFGSFLRNHLRTRLTPAPLRDALRALERRIEQAWSELDPDRLDPEARARIRDLEAAAVAECELLGMTYHGGWWEFGLLHELAAIAEDLGVASLPPAWVDPAAVTGTTASKPSLWYLHVSEDELGSRLVDGPA